MYQSRIDAMDNVFVTQERISQEEINSIYAQHNIMLLPYDCNTYQLRGSAVYQESLGLKRLVVVTDGTGVSGLVGKYGNGISASTDEDFADAVIKLSKIDPDEREKIVGTAVIRYKNDFDKALKNLICDLK